MMLSINMFFRYHETIDYVIATLLMLLGIVSILQYSKIDPVPELSRCLNNCNTFVSSLVMLSLVISYGVTFLTLVQPLFGNAFEGKIFAVSFLVMSISILGYMFICKKKNLF
jgi:hypothetical protein